MSRYIMTASNVLLSEALPNKKYMTVKMRMFSTKENLNHVAVTEAFIDRIIANKDEYVCMPLCADTKKMQDGDIKGLHHLYNEKTGRFMAEMIGAFHNIEKVNDEYGVSLIGEARINKRNPKVCETIERLYESGELNFSSEVMAETVKEEDGVTIVDAEEGNDLYSMAIVSIPAYPEAKALALVAESTAVNTEDNHKGFTALCASDASIRTIQQWIEEMLWETYWPDVFKNRDCGFPQILMVTDTYFIVYFTGSAETYKFEYLISDNSLYVKDIYRVTYVRVEGDETKMENENKPIAEAQEAEVAEVQELEQVEVAKVVEEPAAQVAETEVAEETNEPEAEAVNSESEDKTSELKETIEQLKAQIKELSVYKEEAEKAKAEKEAAERKKKCSELSEYASNNKLDVEDATIASAIQNLDYETLVSEVMKKSVVQKTDVTSRAFEDSVGEDQYGGLLSRV